MKDPILVLTGPTATGKTAISLALAKKVGAEIISADSRQIYHELNIGTAKPTLSERLGIPHHFIDELPLGTPFSAGRFAEEAKKRAAVIRSNGRRPLIVGGSTLYIHALISGLAPIPAIDPSIRAALNTRLLHEGATVLFDELCMVDPAYADTLDVTKTQRIIRGLEVFQATAHPLSSFHRRTASAETTFDLVVLHRPREILYHRINERVDQMLAAGLLDEVRQLLANRVDTDTNALRTIGYQEPIAYLKQEITYNEMVRLIKRNTRRYAKRQLTWFRRYPQARWLDLDETSDQTTGIADILNRTMESG